MVLADGLTLALVALSPFGLVTALSVILLLVVSKDHIRLHATIRGFNRKAKSPAGWRRDLLGKVACEIGHRILR
jgi:hypothetical protein